MSDNIVSDRPPFYSLFRIFLVLIFGFVFIGPVLGLLAASLVYKGDLFQAITDPANHPDIRNGILLSQGVAATIGLVFLPWYYLKVSEHRSLAGFFRHEQHWPLLLITLMIAVMGLALAISPVVEWNAGIQFPGWMSAFGNWVRETEAVAEAIIKSITTNLSPLAFIFTFIVIAILPAIGEELVFRGMIQTEMQRATKNPHVAIWVTAILFSAIHLQFLGFLPRMLIGAFLGYLYFWSGNLWIPMLAHFLNNGIQIIGLYLLQIGVISFDVESTESAPWPVVTVSIAVTLLLLFYLKNYFASRLSPSRDVA